MSAGAYLLAALLVGIGGGLGAATRWGITQLAERAGASWRPPVSELVRPGATVVANFLACFLLGVIVARIGSAGGAGEYGYLMLSVGFCGGLSTLSSAAFDIVSLVRRRSFSLALAYLLLSIGGGMAVLWLGLVIAS
ncbi:fluoride efflux transporter FluC [Brachybacterium saurashtrense]|uniref:Fluoride-specific ion channel FluC n=1 Tax=Brachybacterium saurashtrense TaxID=556288 RepID=A0A345YPY7_9MICO|nr:CrcB family protein [Brachybacterium saurashtrense]AXK45989.1 CrcB family protein [Brachybacterium saurashtrense]RRR23728.1 CrcB family protein [Brachybacterium saurashtrense]